MLEATSQYRKFDVEPPAKLWDLFISHASEDKNDCVRALFSALTAKGYKVWYDESSLEMGDNLHDSIDRGLAGSRYGVVVLSKNFFAKDWPLKELEGLVSRETHGVKLILPIWHAISKEEIRQYSPMLAGRYAARSEEGIERMVGRIISAIGPPAAGRTVGHLAALRSVFDSRQVLTEQKLISELRRYSLGEHVHDQDVIAELNLRGWVQVFDISNFDTEHGRKEYLILAITDLGRRILRSHSN
jgi:hypothetical protein